MAGNLDRKLRLPRIHFRDKRLYFHSEGRRAEDFFVLKNPTVSAGFEHANFDTKGQHSSSRPRQPLSIDNIQSLIQKTKSEEIT